MENGRVTAPDCPTPGELAEFVTGNLSGKAFERIARHVEDCSACETALGTLDDPTDPFFVPVATGGASRSAPPRNPSRRNSWPPRSPATANAAATGLARRRSRAPRQVRAARRAGARLLRPRLPARDTELGRIVAIKMLAGRLASREDVDRFVREAQRRPAPASRHRRALRDRPDRGRPVLPRRGVRPGRDADRTPEGRPVRLPAGGGADRRGRRRAGLRPPARRHPPRHQAVEHPARRGRPAAPDGLRPGQARGRRVADDPGRPGPRHAGLHVARAGARRSRTRSMPAPTSTASASSSTSC